MKQTFLYLLILFAIAVNSCRKGDHDGNDNPPIPDLPKEGVIVSTNVFGRIVDEQDKPLQGVTVAGGGKSTTTDENGIYILTNVSLDQARGYITAVKSGYFNGSRIFQPVKDGTSKPPLIKLLVQKSIGKINAAAGGAAESSGGIKVELPANAIEGYTGQVTVVANYINPTSPDFFARMPGDLAADNSENKRGALVSYGMSDLDLLDDKGNKVKIKAGMQATVTIPVPQKLQASASSTIDMWYFDETKGIWKQEGSGTYQNGKYVGKVAHFSVWNYDHWNPLMILPIILRWIVPNITSMPPEDIENIVNHPPDFILQVRDKKTKNTLYTNTFPPPTPDPKGNPPGGTTTVTFPLPTMTESMEVTVMPVQPGGPDYPTNTNYTPTTDEVPPASPTFASESERVTVDVTPTNPPSTITITVPPVNTGGGGSGQTIVNVNGKAVNCDNKAVTSGYAFLSMRSGNTIVKSTTAPIFGTEGRFTAQYIFLNALTNRIDNVVLTIYDVATGKRSKDLALTVNPSVPYMIQTPVSVCDNTGTGNPGTGTGKVFNGNYSINSAATLKAFIDSAYTEVAGMLYVSNMSDLGGIISLKKVWGLELRSNNITSLGGLAELEDMSFISLVSNNQLINAAFPKIANKSMQGIHINNNLSLVAFTLPSIEVVSPLGNDNISITGNPLLKTLSIPNLKSVDKCGNIEITNTLLENLNTFTNASGTLGGWGMTLVDNPSLTSLSGIKNIVCTARLTIDQCIKLTTLDGINIPADMTDWVSITRNDLLTDITAVSNKLKSTGGLTININAALTTANFPLFEKGNVTCKENGQLSSIIMPKFKETVAVDLTHNIKLATINMSALETVSNSFNLDGGYETVQALATFDLPALKTCGRFLITNCPGIVNLDGFANLTSVTGDFSISNANIPGANVKLKTINGFNKLASIAYSCGLETASGSGYTGPLTSIQGFKSLKTVGAMFTIGGLNLTDISGFASLETIGQDMRIVNTGLTGVEGFPKLTSSGLSENRLINITDNNKLTTLKGFASLTNVVGVFIARNAELKDLQGFEKVTSMKSEITVGQNTKLTNIDGLANVGGTIINININQNTALKNLCGITKLVKAASITGQYSVSGNGYNPTQQQIIAGTCSQ
ncbi:MAG: carboxypeptidase-like regulatory domain-containing protein [Chitinophagaceae bacterium]